jgi:hypothetical protein
MDTTGRQRMNKTEMAWSVNGWSSGIPQEIIGSVIGQFGFEPDVGLRLNGGNVEVRPGT